MAIYGYGIVDKDDKPWWGDDDWCVCQDKDILDDQCEAMNDADKTAIRDPRRPYRVVTLTFRRKP